MRIARGARWLPPSPLDGWCRGALIASAALAALSVALVLDLEHRLGLRAAVGFALLWALPSAVQASEDRLASGRDGRPADLTLLLWIGLAAGLIAAFPAAPWAALLAWPHGLALARGRQDANTAVALGLGALLPLVAVVAHPSVPGATLSALALLNAGLGATWMHARTTRRAFLRRGDPQLAAPVDPAGLAARSAAAALLVGGLLLASLTLEVGAAARERYVQHQRARTTAGPLDATGPAASASADAAADAAAEEAETAPVRHAWPERLAMAGALQPGHPRRMAEVRSSLDDAGPHWGPDNPLYLRARAYDTLDAGGLSLSDQAPWSLYTDAGDGKEDGWTWLRSPELRSRTVRFALRQREHRGGGSERHPSLLLHTEPVLAVDAGDVRWAPGEGLYTRDDEDGLRRLHWTAALPVWPARIATAEEVDARYLQLPDDDPRFARWAEEARRRGAAAEDTEALVSRILARFRTWDYALQVDAGSEGVDALDAFYARRRGYCVMFAAAAMLELRASGVPCRVVTGYRATRFRPEREDGAGLYEVDSSEAHAWLEVALADGTWRPVDPTPARALQAALAGDPAAASTRDPLAADDPEPQDDPSPADAAAPGAAAEGREKPEPSVFVDWIPAWARSLWTDLFGVGPGTGAYGGYFFALPIVVLLHLAVRRHIERLDKLRGREEDPDWLSTSSDWERLLTVLRGYGFRKPRGQTLREFARAVRVRGGPLFADFEGVVATVYRRRWGRVGSVEEEREALAGYRRTIASRAFRRRWEEQSGRGR